MIAGGHMPTVAIPQPHTSGNGFSMPAIILGCIAFLVLPIVAGPAAIVLAGIGKSKHESKSSAALTIAILGTVIGMIIGAIIGTP